MYRNVVRYVCEDCGVRETCDRGKEVDAVEKFLLVHYKHNTHINDFTQPGLSLEDFLKWHHKQARDEVRRQKFIKVLTLGLRGETAEDRRRKRAKFRDIWDSTEPGASGQEDEA